MTETTWGRGLLAWFFVLASGLWVEELPVYAVTIVHSNDVLGEIEPCGCRSNPMGGVVRKANAVRKLSETDSEILQLDAGDLLFPSDAMPELLLKQSELQAKYLAKAMDLMKHDAFVPGEKDFAMGFEVFKNIRKGIAFRALAANLKKQGGAKVFEGHAIFERKDPSKKGKNKSFRIGVIGLVGDELAWPRELKVSAPIPAAKAEVKALKGKVDLLIALTHQGYEKDVALAKAVPGIDIIIGGHTQTFLQKPVQIGKTWIYQSSFRNQYLGVIPVKRPIQPEDYKLLAMDVSYDSPAPEVGKPSQPGKMDELVKEFKVALAKVNSEKEMVIDQATSARNGYDEAAPAPAGPRYHTFPRCAECHQKQFDFWRGTPHVRALQSLLDKQQSMNKDCLTCHSVGLGDPLGFSDITRLAEFHHLGSKTPPPAPSPSPASSVQPVVSPASSDSTAESGDGGASQASGDDMELVSKIEPLTHEELVSFLKSMQSASSLKSEIKIRKGESSLPLQRAVAAMSRSWAPVQCENCHQAGENHPFSGTFSKKVENTVCFKCHTTERAPEWYTSSGQPDLSKIQSKRTRVSCPAGEMEPDAE